MSFSISFDPVKSDKNEAERGLPFWLVDSLDWGSALLTMDTRKNYGESRYLVLGMIHGRLHAMVFTPRADRVHVISLRKANSREVQKYEQSQSQA